jgi:MerR family copper efflux transcriptional regulator
MNIGLASGQSQLSLKAIRYYEDIELVKPSRAENGYRNYSDKDVHRLKFLQRSRSLGFTIEECRLLLSLYEDDLRASADVKSITRDKIAQVDRKIAELKTLRQTLATLSKNCLGNDRPDCPIINDLAGMNDQRHGA